MKFFIKYSPLQAFLSSTGRSIRFPDFGNGYGGMATDSPTLIAEFEQAIAKSRGGLQSVTEQEFEDVKKKASQTPSSLSLSPSASLKDLSGAAAPLRRAAAERKAGARSDNGMIKVPGVGGAVQIPAPKTKVTNFKPGSVRR